MFEVRTEKPKGHVPDNGPSLSPDLMHDPRSEEQMAEEDERKAHLSLMEVLHDEGERQAEERFQMAVDEDYHDHLQWRPEDAQVLIERGQAPLVFNEGRQTIDWIAGTEKRMRTDYKVFPREPDDTQGAELKTKLVKYTDDVNFTQWHHSKAFKQAIIAGLSWIEEGINPNPEEEIIYSGMESWRNVIRDSRSKDVMRRDARFLFRRKRLDLDYATAMLGNLPNSEQKLRLLSADAHRGLVDEDDDSGPWYLGQKLTGASEYSHGGNRARSFDERGAFMQSTGGYWDTGRRMSVDMIEAWYRRPTKVQVLVGGDFDGKIHNPADPRLAWEVKRNGAILRDAVKMQMHVMIATEATCFYNGPSPFRHGQFLLTPIFAYQRARDGQAYGVWRGMRDLSDDTNKRRSKALWQLSVNQVLMEAGSTEGNDIEAVREEASRPDGVIIYKAGKKLEFREHQGDIAGNLEMARENTQIMRNIGGVTNENLGQDTSARSGKAILAKQDQGSLTTSELFDNLLLAKKMAGQLRLSHMEQFMTSRRAIRIAGGRKPISWEIINELDPQTGEIKNDVTRRQADFIVETQDYRSTMAQAALEQMFDLLGKIATFAPQVVLNVLDLLVETADIKDKEEWVARIRKLNGQRDPSKEPTPEELAQEKVAAAKMAKNEATMELLQEAELKLKQAMGAKTDIEATMKTVETAMKRMETMAAALEVAGIVVGQPDVADAADTLTQAAGLEDKGAAAPNMAQMSAMPALPAPTPEEPAMSAPEDVQTDPMAGGQPEMPPVDAGGAAPQPTGEIPQ